MKIDTLACVTHTVQIIFHTSLLEEFENKTNSLIFKIPYRKCIES